MNTNLTMPTSKEIEELDKLNQSQNEGRGIVTVHAILKELKKNNIHGAITIRFNDGDKITSYTEIEKKITSMLGCRLHAKKGCNQPFCK